MKEGAQKRKRGMTRPDEADEKDDEGVQNNDPAGAPGRPGIASHPHRRIKSFSIGIGENWSDLHFLD
jgi:hypothetical protein